MRRLMHRDYSIGILDKSVEIRESGGVHIIYVVDGSCALELSGQTVSLKKVDAYILNFRELARLEIPKGCLAALLSIDYFALCELYSRPQTAFTMSSSNKRYNELCSRIQLLLLAYAGGGPANVCRELGEFYLLLQLLLNHFQTPSSGVGSAEETGMNRLLSILRSGAGMDMTLNELAAEMFLSPAARDAAVPQGYGREFQRVPQARPAGEGKEGTGKHPEIHHQNCGGGGVHLVLAVQPGVPGGIRAYALPVPGAVQKPAVR